MMSIMLDNNNHRRRMDQQPISGGFLGRTNNALMFQQSNSNFSSSSSSSSSSIGMNSDDDDDCGEEGEVESKLNISPFNSAVEALEQALPIRRGISNFYNGKSKSFTSLADTSTSSIKDLTKPENAYSRKRKNIVAYNVLYDHQSSKSPRLGVGMTKKASRNALALAVAVKNCEGGVDDSKFSPPPPPSPPLSTIPPSPWRSFSLADLQHCAVTASALNTNLMRKRTKHDQVS